MTAFNQPTASDPQRDDILYATLSRDAGECGCLPPGKTWPVCSRPYPHTGRHESADFQWNDRNWFELKGSSGG